MNVTHTRSLVLMSAVAPIVFALAMAFPLSAQAREQRPFNRVVILLDRSGSFADNLPAARDIAWKYARNLANTSSDDEVYVIGVDHAPSEIAYIKGVRSRRQAGAEFDQAFRHVSRGLGTDWVTGLQKATNLFALPPTPGACHLLVFGDLCVDDAKDAASGQLIRRVVPLAQFDWSSLDKVNGSMWFVDGNVRDELMSSPSFRSLGFEVNALESAAKARDRAAPRRVRGGSDAEKPVDGGCGTLVQGVAIAWWAHLVLDAPAANGRNGNEPGVRACRKAFPSCPTHHTWALRWAASEATAFRFIHVCSLWSSLSGLACCPTSYGDRVRTVLGVLETSGVARGRQLDLNAATGWPWY